MPGHALDVTYSKLGRCVHGGSRLLHEVVSKAGVACLTSQV